MESLKSKRNASQVDDDIVLYPSVMDGKFMSELVVLTILLKVTGVTSGALGSKFINNIFEYDNYELVVNQRRNGNGINDVLTKNILKYEHIDLVILSDHGSSDRANLTKIRDHFNCKVIVTDHHLFKEELAPFNMDAFINPQRYDNDFKDLTGTHVLYYVLLHAFLISDMEKTTDKVNYYYYLLTYVGITIISDCMDLKNYINKKVLIKTITDMNSKRTHHEAFWKVILDRVSTSSTFDESTIGYKIAPLLNSPGRIADPRLSVELMLSEDLTTADNYYDDIIRVNNARKEMQKDALNNPKNISFNDENIKVMLVEDSEGVQGIVANSVMQKENFKMVLCFTREKTENGTILKGSGRAQFDDISLKDLVDSISVSSDLILKHGGHKKAIGMAVKDDLELLFNTIKNELDNRLSKLETINTSSCEIVSRDTYYIDSYIYSIKNLLLTIFDIHDIGPYGIGYEKPTFASFLRIVDYKLFKKSNNFLTMKVKLSHTDSSVFTVFYNVRDDELEYIEESLRNKDDVLIVYNLSIDSYRNYNKILLNGISLKFS